MKKTLSVILSFCFVISLFACISGLPVYAIDNTPEPQAVTEKIYVTESSEKEAAKSEEEKAKEQKQAAVIKKQTKAAAPLLHPPPPKRKMPPLPAHVAKMRLGLLIVQLPRLPFPVQVKCMIIIL